KSGYWDSGDADRMDDPRANTLRAYLRVLEDTLPETFLLENVHGLAYRGKDEGLRYLLRGVARINRLKRTNYQVRCEKLNAAHYGGPQTRDRVFLIAHREGREFVFPKRTHGPPADTQTVGLESFHTAWDAIGDLPANPREESLAMTGNWADLL